ncbi:hypothetical protein H8D04_00550 [bacterium]|nr:hypothetical protein [bacterium]
MKITRQYLKKIISEEVKNIKLEQTIRSIVRREIQSYKERNFPSDKIDSVHEGTYQDFFRSALKKWGVSEPDQLDDEEKSKFFNFIDKNWSAEEETD